MADGWRKFLLLPICCLMVFDVFKPLRVGTGGGFFVAHWGRGLKFSYSSMEASAPLALASATCCSYSSASFMAFPGLWKWLLKTKHAEHRTWVIWHPKNGIYKKLYVLGQTQIFSKGQIPTFSLNLPFFSFHNFLHILSHYNYISKSL